MTIDELIQQLQCYDANCSGCKHDKKLIEQFASEARERTIQDVEQMADYMADEKLDVGEKAVKVAAYLLGMKLRLNG